MSVASRSPTSLLKISATSSFVRWIAGITMCEGRWPASWMIHSPRSVSFTSIPASRSAALRWTSSEAIDFDFATFFTPFSRARSTMYRRTSSGLRRRTTFAPRASASLVNRAASSGRRPAASPLIPAIRPLTASKSTPWYAFARLAGYAS